MLAVYYGFTEASNHKFRQITDMPKKKVNTEPPTAFISRSWKVHSGYELETAKKTEFTTGESGKTKRILVKKRVIAPKGAVGKTFDLSNSSLHSDMLSGFIAVSDEESLLDWIREFGFPFDDFHNDLEVEKVLAAVGSTQWLWRLIENRRDPTTLEGWVSESEVYGSWYWNLARRIHEIVQSDPAQLKKFPKLAEFGRNVRETKRRLFTALTEAKRLTPSEMEFMRLFNEFQAYDQTVLNISFSPTATEVPLYAGFRDSYYSDGSPVEIAYNRKLWEGDRDQYLAYAAQTYIGKCLDRLLKEVHPTLEWRQFMNGSWQMASSFSVGSPWEAMALQLYNKTCSGLSLRKCRKPDCNVMGSWPGQRYYCSEKCEKWCSRHPDTIGQVRRNRINRQTVASAERTRKGQMNS